MILEYEVRYNAWLHCSISSLERMKNPGKPKLSGRNVERPCQMAYQA